ncbi:GtrA family protein [Specibacter sp. NPDC057265]|uniref:GtrA family protein n=1 Tax=Specibacter sp. NPDC057265 TaxID=3346075 RepID=UPI003639E2FE
MRFLLVGGLSFAIDLGLLVLLHEGFAVDLWIATPIAFLSSLVFNFLAQRSFTFESTRGRGSSMIRYGALVVFNTFMTDVIVNLFHNLDLTYTVGKIVATALTMIWNFFLYKHWVFHSTVSTANEKPSSVTVPSES